MRPVSVVIPVLHEPDIGEFVTMLFNRFPQEWFEVIVVDGDPEGRSIATVQRAGVTTLVAKAGRGPQMNAGARVSRGELLLFLHADTQLPDKAFQKIRETMETDGYDAGAFALGFAGEKTVFFLISRAASLRCRLTGIPYGDQAFFIQRDYFFRVGGFKEIAVMEDIDLMCRIRKMGGRIRILPEAVQTSTRRWEKEGMVFSLFRTWTLAILYRCGVSPDRLKGWYRPYRP